MTDASRAELEVRAAVSRVTARLRLRDALRGLVQGLLVVGVLAAIAIVAVRFGGVGRGIALLALGGGVLATAVTVALLARPVSTIVAASMADRALGLSDRLTSAVAFLDERAPTPLQRAAIEDAARVGPDVDAAFVVALALPRAARWLPLVAALVAAAALVRLPVPPAAPSARAPKPKLVVEPDALGSEREELRRLAAEARGKDEKLAALATKLDALLASIDEQKMSRAEVFAELAKLEAAYARPREAGATKPSELLAPVTKSLAQAKLAKALAEALKKDDLETARQELAKLAAAAEKRDEEQQGARELQRALDEAGRKLDEAQKKKDDERNRKIEQLKDEERRLRKRHEEHPEDEENERRLQRNKRELERLEREKEAEAEQRRQLQRLSKDLEDAAEELRKKMSPEAMKKMAEELGKMQDEIRKLESSDKAQQQIAQLKEMLRRAGRIEVCTGSGCSDGQRRGEGQDGEGKGGQGKDGQKRGERLRDFDQRAGGTETLVLGGEGQDKMTLPLPLGQGQAPGPAGEGRSGDGDPKGPGDGIGKDHDPDVLGDKTSMKTDGRIIRAQGAAGPGPSRSQTILEASERGFSKKGYGRVYKDYAAVVEEVMSQEGVPPGYRYYVKRYFQLIRPRE